MNIYAVIIGQSELAVERFREDTQHMIIGRYEKVNLHMTRFLCADYA